MIFWPDYPVYNASFSPFGLKQIEIIMKVFLCFGFAAAAFIEPGGKFGVFKLMLNVTSIREIR